MPPNENSGQNAPANEPHPVDDDEPLEGGRPPTHPHGVLGSSSFIYRRGLALGVVMLGVYLLPLGDVSFYAIPALAAAAGFLVGMASYGQQQQPFFMASLRHGAWAGVLSLVPLVVAVFLLANANILEMGGVAPEDAILGRTTLALGLCCAGVPFAMLLGALGGMGGHQLAHMRNHPVFE